jgi:hypothetical protein
VGGPGRGHGPDRQRGGAGFPAAGARLSGALQGGPWAGLAPGLAGWRAEARPAEAWGRESGRFSVPSGRAMARRRPVPCPRGSCDRGARGAGLRPAAAGSSRPGGCTRPAWRDGPRSWGGSDHRVGLSPSGPFKEHDPPGCQAAWIGRPVAGAALGRGHGLCFPGGDTVSLPRSGCCGRSPHGPRPRPCTRAGGLRVQGARSHKVAASTSRGAGWQREVKDRLTAWTRAGALPGEMPTSLGIGARPSGACKPRGATGGGMLRAGGPGRVRRAGNGPRRGCRRGR